MLIVSPPPQEISHCPDADFDFKEHFYQRRGSMESIREDLMICVLYVPSHQRIGPAHKPYQLTSPSTMISAPGVRTALAWEEKMAATGPAAPVAGAIPTPETPGGPVYAGTATTVPVRISPQFIETALDAPFDPSMILTRPFARDRDVDDRDAIIEHIVSAMVADARGGFSAGLAFQQSLALALVHQALAPSARSTGMSRKSGALPPRQLRLVTDMIDADPSARLSLVDLAQRIGVSTRYLSKSFKAATGLSPHQFILRRRIDHARKLIDEGKASLSQVALSAGFSDHSQMSATFRKILNKPPSFFLRDH